MTPEEIPQPLLDIVDRRAGKVHSRQGPVVECLAEVLTVYNEIVGTNPLLLTWVIAQYRSLREDIHNRNTSLMPDVEWERAPIDYDDQLTESQMVGERVPPEEVSYRPQRTLHGSGKPKHEG